ncbi:hypothetical protein KUTeg_002750 [Tegillarca granosa]|uniref:Uncharacterized protein n=1 Tax=Tegillarca granosa TaxID=220873 RepID=A0ABQ9FUR6_TEGGR|nr:hypothetical protein KUTeg_002750 [Tegillarca granosa]
MDVLKPLKTVTTIMCDEKCPTIAMIIPMKYRIIDNLCENPVDSKLTKEVKQVIRDDLNKRYSDSDVRDFLLLAAALDPRFKSLPMLSSEERESVFSNVKSEPEVVQNPDCNSEPALPSLPVDSDKVNNDKSNTEGLNDGPTPPKKSAIEDLLGDVYVVSCTPGNQKSVSDIVASEVADYKQEDDIPLKELDINL